MTDAAAHPPRLILCAGLPRSGSTWLYNVVRLAAAAERGDDVYGCWVGDYDRTHPAPTHVVKLHEPDETLLPAADAVVMTRRDLRDIAASLVRRGWNEPGPTLLARLEAIVATHAWWRRHAAIELEYGEVMRDPIDAIRKIVRLLLPGRDEHLASRIEAEVRALRHTAGPDRPYDEVNLLHPEHIRDGRVGSYADVLSETTIASINERFGPWLAAHGYDASPTP